MRSRYSAYVLGNEAYLLATWHPDTRPAVRAGSGRRCAGQKLGLDVLDQAGRQATHKARCWPVIKSMAVLGACAQPVYLPGWPLAVCGSNG